MNVRLLIGILVLILCVCLLQPYHIENFEQTCSDYYTSQNYPTLPTNFANVVDDMQQAQYLPLDVNAIDPTNISPNTGIDGCVISPSLYSRYLMDSNCVLRDTTGVSSSVYQLEPVGSSSSLEPNGCLLRFSDYSPNGAVFSDVLNVAYLNKTQADRLILNSAATQLSNASLAYAAENSNLNSIYASLNQANQNNVTLNANEQLLSTTNQALLANIGSISQNVQALNAQAGSVSTNLTTEKLASQYKFFANTLPAFVLGPANMAPWYCVNFPVQSAQWIWNIANADANAPVNTLAITFQKVFQFKGGSPVSATIITVTDNYGTLVVNGKTISQQNILGGEWGNNRGSGSRNGITILPGTNIIQIPSYNQGGPAGLLVACEDNNGNILFVSDSSWTWA